jgi:protein TonB
MELKKNPEADIERKKNLFFALGLVFSLALVLVAFEWKQFEGGGKDLGQLTLQIEEDEMIPITQVEVPPPPPPPPQTQIVEIVEDDKELDEELELESTDLDEKTTIEFVEFEEKEVAEPEIFTIVEEMPGFPGGEAKLFEYLGKETKFPPMARDAGIQGTVFVRFVVYEDGAIKDVTVVRSVHPALDEEAIRVIKAMPKWKPGKQRGKPVRVQYNLPIKFILR